eukprot:COSAG06_NODE_2245_length_7263_cov_19.964964_3_plen_33_part_00
MDTLAELKEDDDRREVAIAQNKNNAFFGAILF